MRRCSVLDPRFKNEACDTKEDAVALLTAIRAESVPQASGAQADRASGRVQASEAPPGTAAEPPDGTAAPWKPSAVEAFFAASPSPNDDQVHRYLDDKPPAIRDDPLAWWRRSQDPYPGLAAAARRYFAIPATSAPVERLFSVAGYVMSDRRCRMSPQTFEMLVGLRRIWGG